MVPSTDQFKTLLQGKLYRAGCARTSIFKGIYKMKVTKEKLQKIIQEELDAAVESGEITEQQLQELLPGLKAVGKAAWGGIKKGAAKVRDIYRAGEKGSQAGAQQQTDTAPSAAQQQAAQPAGQPAQPAAADQQAQPAAAPIKFTPPVEDATGEPAQKPAAAQPEAPAQQPAAPKDAVADSTADVVMPHAVVLKGLLTKQIAQSLQKVLGGLPQDQRKTVMTPVMQYINNLPGMASKVIAEEISPEQQALKAKLAAKHAGNISLIGKNLQALEGEIMNSIKSQLNIDNTPNLLFQAIEKAYGNTKEGLQYMKSLQKNPQGHLNSLLQNAQLVVKNIMSLVQKNMPKAPEGQPKLGAPQQPGANAAAMAKKPAAAKPQAKPAAPPVQESYKATYDKWQKIIKG
jgi:hypothetical protein